MFGTYWILLQLITRIIIAFAIAFPVIVAIASTFTFIITIVVPLLLLHFVITIWRIQSLEPLIDWIILHGDSLDLYACDDWQFKISLIFSASARIIPFSWGVRLSQAAVNPKSERDESNFFIAASWSWGYRFLALTLKFVWWLHLIQRKQPGEDTLCMIADRRSAEIPQGRWPLLGLWAEQVACRKCGVSFGDGGGID